MLITLHESVQVKEKRVGAFLHCTVVSVCFYLVVNISSLINFPDVSHPSSMQDAEFWYPSVSWGTGSKSNGWRKVYIRLTTSGTSMLIIYCKRKWYDLLLCQHLVQLLILLIRKTRAPTLLNIFMQMLYVEVVLHDVSATCCYTEVR